MPLCPDDRIQCQAYGPDPCGVLRNIPQHIHRDQPQDIPFRICRTITVQPLKHSQVQKQQRFLCHDRQRIRPDIGKYPHRRRGTSIQKEDQPAGASFFDKICRDSIQQKQTCHQTEQIQYKPAPFTGRDRRRNGRDQVQQQIVQKGIGIIAHSVQVDIARTKRFPFGDRKIVLHLCAGIPSGLRRPFHLKKSSLLLILQHILCRSEQIARNACRTVSEDLRIQIRTDPTFGKHPALFRLICHTVRDDLISAAVGILPHKKNGRQKADQ